MLTGGIILPRVRRAALASLVASSDISQPTDVQTVCEALTSTYADWTTAPFGMVTPWNRRPV